MTRDVRKAIEDMAHGRRLVDTFGAPTLIDEAAIKKHQATFRAWYSFSQQRDAGEALAAPAELLTPLP